MATGGNKILAFGLFLCSNLLQSVVSGQQCGTVGRTDQTERSNTNAAFYLDFRNTAGCSGMITSVNYCFSAPEQTDQADEYLATFAVYRPEGSTTYRNASTAIAIHVTEDQVKSILGSNTFNSNSFGCSTFNLGQPLPIEAEDALGVCVFDPPGDNVHPLNLVIGMGSGDNSWRIRVGSFQSGTPPDSCSETSVPDIVTDSDVSSRLLYLSANIVTPTTPPITEPAMTTTSEVPLTPMRSITEIPGVTTAMDSTTRQSTDSGDRADDSNGATTAAAVIIVIIIIVSVVVVVVIIVLVMWRQQQSTKSFRVDNTTAISNEIYTVAGDKFQQGKPSPQLSQSQEHIYEFESSANKSNEYMYAEVGPGFEETQNGEIVYESPLDGPVISYSKLLEKNKEEDIYVSEDPYEVPASIENDIYAQLNTWGVRRIKANELEIVCHLGSGQFGSVEQGVWKRQGTGPVDVALKSLTKTSEEDKVKFLQEAAIMAQFRHPNVIMLHGVAIKGDPMMLVVELAKKGDLREYLLSLRPDPGELLNTSTPQMLLKFSQQVALGMQYLSAKGFVHRDLAARNVLVTSNNMCKVADFGMSRDLADENYYVSQGKDKIPVKWTAPEAIHYKKYSTASDVWSYGCLLYEIWSIGHKPFERVSNYDVIRVVDEGKRLSPPPGCPKMIYELMILCWHPETSQRVAFRDIVLTLTGSEKMVLNIPEEDSSTNPLAGVLGAPLEAVENMYSELQRRYVDFHHEPQAETDGDYFNVH